jgi:2-(1,2-epoxy-1,2-dihydrophenyl)acetyl-CoA isomerase
MNLEALKTIECTVNEGVARVALNQPDRGNPIDAASSRELKELVNALSEREDVRAVLLTAHGRMFSVGGDINAFTEDHGTLAETVKVWTSDLHTAISRLMRMRAPVVAAVHGSVGGGSVSLIAAADVVYATRGVKFVSGFAQIGFSADSGSTVTLVQRMGWARAKRFLLLSETISAEEALVAGLVDFVVRDRDALAQEAEAMARKLASGPTLALGAIKQLMLRGRTQGAEAQMEDEAQTLASIVRSNDTREGVQAFLERRVPAFTGH